MSEPDTMLVNESIDDDERIAQTLLRTLGILDEVLAIYKGINSEPKADRISERNR